LLNQKIKKYSICKKIIEADEKLLKTDIEKIIAEDTGEDDDQVSMTFSYLKSDLHLIVMYVEDIENMCKEATIVEESIKKILHGFVDQEYIKNLKLFKSEEEDIKKYLERMVRKAEELRKHIRILESAEDGEEKTEKEIEQIEQSVKKVFKTFYSLMKNLNRVSIEFNHAIQTVKDIKITDEIIKLELKKHLHYLKNGTWVMPTDEEDKKIAKMIEEREKKEKHRPQYLYDENSGVSKKEYEQIMEKIKRKGRDINRISKKEVRKIEEQKKKSA